jgi:hypothetical protein
MENGSLTFGGLVMGRRSLGDIQDQFLAENTIVGL